jgi:hypothetical protein
MKDRIQIPQEHILLGFVPAEPDLTQWEMGEPLDDPERVEELKQWIAEWEYYQWASSQSPPIDLWEIKQ